MLNYLTIYLSDPYAFTHNEAYVADVFFSTSSKWKKLCLQKLNQDNHFDHIQIVIPSELTSFTVIKLPEKSNKHLDKIIPNIVEEKVAQDIETMHLSRGKASDSNTASILSIEKGLIKQILEQCHKLSLYPDSIFTDAQYLTSDENTLSLFIDNKRALINCNRYSHFVSDIANLSDSLDTLCSTNKFKKIALFNSEEANNQHLLTLKTLEANHNLIIESNGNYQDFYSLINRPPDLTENSAFINLLQGEFQPNKKKNSDEKKQRLLLLGLSGLFIFTIAYQLVMGWYYNQQGDELYNQSLSIYKEAFPNDKRIINVRTQTLAHLKNSGHNTNQHQFLDLISSLGHAWQASDQATHILHIRFEKNGEMILEASAKTIDALETLRQTLTNNQLDTKLLSANEDGDRIYGRIQIVGEIQ